MIVTVTGILVIGDWFLVSGFWFLVSGNFLFTYTPLHLAKALCFMLLALSSRY